MIRFLGVITLLPAVLADIYGSLYVQADDGTSGNELWKSDGTASGTVMIKDVNPGTSVFGGTGLLGDMVAFNGKLFFTGVSADAGVELWATDGTEAGTALFKDINSGTGNSFPNSFTVYKGNLYFQANSGSAGTEMWRSDGSAAGTSLFYDVNPGSGSGLPGMFVECNGLLFFKANDGSTGDELWKTDGTTSGTMLVKDIFSGDFGSSTNPQTCLNNKLLFSANDGARRSPHVPPTCLPRIYHVSLLTCMSCSGRCQPH